MLQQIDLKPKNTLYKSNLTPLLSPSNIAPHFLRSIFCWILFWGILLLGFIAFIDPYGVSPLQIAIPHINGYKPKRIDIDRLIKPYEVWRYQPKTIFIGTSRIHESMDPEVLNGSAFAPAYNAAIPASTLAENAEHIKTFIKLDPHLKHIFVELFLYNFTGQPQTISHENFSSQIQQFMPLQISINALFDAVKTLKYNFKNENTYPAQITKYGFWLPSSDFNPADTFSDVLYARTVLGWDKASKLNLQLDAFQSLNRIIDLAHKHHIQLHLIMTPTYPWEDYRLMSLGYWPMLEAWLRKIATYSNVVSFSQHNQLTEETIINSPKMQWWNDPTHFSLKMGRIMMETYLGKPNKNIPSNFMVPLNTKTVEKMIKERKIDALRWAKNHPEFVNGFEESKQIKDSVDGSLDLAAKKLTVNDHIYELDKGIGEVSFITKTATGMDVSGWAADDIAKTHVISLVAAVGNKIVAQGFATVKRSDISSMYKKEFNSGFIFSIPLIDNNEKVRVFALMKNGRAVQLKSQAPEVSSA